MRKLFTLAFLFALFGLPAKTVSPRLTESFNSDWRFARFGLQPDGTRLPEPGEPSSRFLLSASSEESGNAAEFAMDGDPSTRWCASDGSPDQWLAIDLGGEFTVSRAEVQWENPGLQYGFVIERSIDGKQWEPLSGTARKIRVRVTSLPAGKWASIREVKLFDAAGAEIRNTRAAIAAIAPSAVTFNDSQWRKLDVPHDWGIEGPFRYDLEGNTGKLPWKGIGWYRKYFTVSAADEGKRIAVVFEGAMANAQVWLNGQYVGGWPYGYQGFQLDLTDKIKFGAENVLAVRLDTEKWGSRWYPGAGIYRNVWLLKTEPVHISQWGVFVTTPKISEASGEADIAVTVDNPGGEVVKTSVNTEIFELGADDVIGQKVADSAAVQAEVPAGASKKIQLNSAVARPELWDLAAPNRYLARTTVSVGGNVVDVYDQPFGFRTIEFTHDDGFHLNGKRVQIQGTCNHSDLGALGMAFNTRAMERELQILKDMGCNALRTSHNPPAPEFLDLADKMGFVVMCEAFDCWAAGKRVNDYSRLYPQWRTNDLQAMVRHFRNHPSVVIWSTGNEVSEQDTLNPAKELRDIIHAEDPTRPVSAGVWDGAAKSEFRLGVDVQGLNYCIDQYGKLLAYPGNEAKPFYASESSSCISSRGEYFFPPERGNDSRANFQISSYDVDAPGWACTPDEEFSALDHNPGFAGEFVWTGFDYLGEPTPYNDDLSNLLNIHDKDPAKMAAMKKELAELGKIRCPSRSSYFGIVDLAGFPKDRYYLYQARWRPELQMAHILPHWNWPDRIGQVTPVHVYTSGDSAELFLNGQSLGKKTRGQYDYRLRWDDVKYEPGTLKVVAYKEGKEWATDTVKTTGEPAKLVLSADCTAIAADGADLSYITVCVEDKSGLTVPTADNQIKFTIEGPGEIIATDNGDATSFVPFQSHERPAFNGLALAIVRSKKGESGIITVKAESGGLAGARVTLTQK
jgi:beta-galactosidase